MGFDSKSIVNLFYDSGMLTNIRKTSLIMKIQCNAGVKEIKHVGHLSGHSNIYFDARVVTDILSLELVTSRFKVTSDGSAREEFVFYSLDGRPKRIQRSWQGPYALRMLFRAVSFQGRCPDGSDHRGKQTTTFKAGR